MRVAACLFVTALAAFALPGCFGSSAQQTRREASGTETPGIPVTVAPVVQKDMPLEISLIGTTEAYATVVVRAQITGELTSVNFEQGDDVHAGQVLFTLDRRPLEAALHQAEANLARDSAQADQARVSAQRTQDLADRGLVPREQVDQTRASATALAATVAADRAAVENASVQLQYATIRAPIAGRTGALMVSAGNLVRANDQAPLAIINQVTPTYVSFAISETLLPEFKRYMAKGSLRVEATPPNDEGPAAAGQITFVDNTVDQTTGTIKIKGTFPNLDRRLWPGQFVNVVVTAGDRRRGDRGAVPRRSDGPGGPIRLRCHTGSNGGDEDRQCRADRRGRDRDQRGRQSQARPW